MPPTVEGSPESQPARSTHQAPEQPAPGAPIEAQSPLERSASPDRKAFKRFPPKSGDTFGIELGGQSRSFTFRGIQTDEHSGEGQKLAVLENNGTSGQRIKVDLPTFMANMTDSEPKDEHASRSWHRTSMALRSPEEIAAMTKASKAGQSESRSTTSASKVEANNTTLATSGEHQPSTPAPDGDPFSRSSTPEGAIVAPTGEAASVTISGFKSPEPGTPSADPNEPAIRRVNRIGGDPDDKSYKPGDSVLYREEDGDQEEHEVIGFSKHENPGLILRNKRTNTVFAVAGETPPEEVTMTTPPPEDTPSVSSSVRTSMEEANRRGNRAISSSGGSITSPPTSPPGGGPVYGSPRPGPVYGPPTPDNRPIYGPPEPDITLPDPLYGPPAPVPHMPEVTLAGPEAMVDDPEFLAVRDQLTSAIDRLARAKDRNDSIFSKLHRKVDGRNDEAELSAAGDNLKEVFTAYVAAVARRAHENTLVARAEQARLKVDFDARVDPALAATLQDTQNQYWVAHASGNFAEAQRLQALYYSQVGTGDPSLEALARRHWEIDAQAKNQEQAMTLMIVQEMASARLAVDEKQLEIKMSKPGGRAGAKFREWWTKHPKMRVGIGLALTAGTLAASTVAPPLGLGLFALKRGFAGVGTYMGVEGAGRAWGESRSRKSSERAAQVSLADIAEAPGSPADADFVRRDAERISSNRANSGVEIAGREKEDIARFVEQNYKDIFLAPNSLSELLRGANVDPSGVVESLLGDKLEQLRKDSNWTRRSKYAGAVGAVTVGAVSYMQFMHARDALNDDLTKAYFQGIVDHHGPTSAHDWAALQAARPGVGQALWDSNPNHGTMENALSGWRKAIAGLPADKQLIAAKMIGAQQDAGTLSPTTIKAIVSGL